MTRRSNREMEALLVKLNAQMGPLEKWSAEALETLDSWMADLRLDINEEILTRDDESAERDIRQPLQSFGAGVVS